MNRAASKPGPQKEKTQPVQLSQLTRFEGVEFLLAAPVDEKAPCDSWGGWRTSPS